MDVRLVQLLVAMWVDCSESNWAEQSVTWLAEPTGSNSAGLRVLRLVEMTEQQTADTRVALQVAHSAALTADHSAAHWV